MAHIDGKANQRVPSMVPCQCKVSPECEIPSILRVWDEVRSSPKAAWTSLLSPQGFLPKLEVCTEPAHCGWVGSQCRTLPIFGDWRLTSVSLGAQRKMLQKEASLKKCPIGWTKQEKHASIPNQASEAG